MLDPIAAAPHVFARLDDESESRHVWSVLGRADLLRTVYSEGQPSTGVDFARLARLIEAVDERCSIGATLPIVVQLTTALPILAAEPGPARDVAERAVTGELSVALAVTDMHSGTDLLSMGTSAVIDDLSVVLNGAKSWIASGMSADYFLVLARKNAARHFTSFVWLLVPSSAEGVSRRAVDSNLYPCSGMASLEFRDVVLPRDVLVGRSGRGLTTFTRHIAVERLGSALWGVALCRRVVQRTVGHLAMRPHGDNSLWEVESIRQRVAACVVEIEELGALAASLGRKVTDDYDTVAGAMLKAATGATVASVLSECAQLHGAEGFVRGGLQELRAQAAAFGVGGGPTEVALSIVADGLERVFMVWDRERAGLIRGQREDARPPRV